MEDFATYILNEPNYLQKMLIVHYMAEKTGIFFDKSIILRTQIGKMFLNYASLDVDKNVVLTELLLCNCKKVDNSQKLGKLETYAKEGAEYLSTLGFDKKFCKACEGLNRYVPAETRSKESDILEVIDQFSGLILRRAEREAFTPQEALIILKERNLKDADNRYLNDFCLFVDAMENVYIHDNIDVPVLRKLAKLTETEPTVKSFISKLSTRYADEIDKLMGVNIKEQAEEVLYKDLDDKEEAEEETNPVKKTVKTVHKYTGPIIDKMAVVNKSIDEDKKTAFVSVPNTEINDDERSLFTKDAEDRILSGKLDFKRIIEESPAKEHAEEGRR